MALIGKPVFEDENFENYGVDYDYESQGYYGVGYWEVPITRLIKKLRVGDNGFIEPQALIFNSAGRAFLNLKGGVINARVGEHQLPIKRIGKGRGDFDIFIEEIPFVWIKSDNYFEEEYVRKNYARLCEYSEKDLNNSLGVRHLKTKLELAVKDERYEEAARIRDMMKEMNSNRLPGCQRDRKD